MGIARDASLLVLYEPADAVEAWCLFPVSSDELPFAIGPEPRIRIHELKVPGRMQGLQ